MGGVSDQSMLSHLWFLFSKQKFKTVSSSLFWCFALNHWGHREWKQWWPLSWEAANLKPRLWSRGFFGVVINAKLGGGLRLEDLRKAGGGGRLGASSTPLSIASWLPWQSIIWHLRHMHFHCYQTFLKLLDILSDVQPKRAYIYKNLPLKTRYLNWV